MPFISQVDFSHGWALLLDKIYSFSKMEIRYIPIFSSEVSQFLVSFS